ncbi:MAG: DUF4830 domain-containing protein [Clostridia bacterium]|nr:DUF4830 domain-containing protein [Clostridia bacterium]
MFVISVKSSKLKNAAFISLIFVFVTIGAVYLVGKTASAPAAKVGGVIMKAETAEDRIAFFSQFGWEVSQDPCEVKEVIIPTEFDEVYSSYNELQKSQGLDLEKFKGARVKMWSYEILNYPGYEDSAGVIRGNLLIYNSVVIACDISSTELDGFMEGIM